MQVPPCEYRSNLFCDRFVTTISLFCFGCIVCFVVPVVAVVVVVVVVVVGKGPRM